MNRHTIIILSFLHTLIGYAQNASDIDLAYGSSFNNGYGIEAIAIQPNEKIVVCGTFKSFNDNIQNRVVRLNIDGTKDTSFNIGSGFPAQVYSISVQPDSKILIGGSFRAFNGEFQKYIVRLNPDGSKDNTFTDGSLFNDLSSSVSIKTISLQSDGKIIVGGYFKTGKIKNIVRLNPDGTKDTSFDIGNGLGLTSGNGMVNSIVVQADGKILVGGSFNILEGTNNYISNLLRLNSDGTIDNSFTLYNSNTGFDKSIETISVQRDGKILVGGKFTTFNNEPHKNLIRLNYDGTLDTSFELEGKSFDRIGGSDVQAIAIQSDGKILVGGAFTSFNGQFQPFFIRLNHNGARDSSFDIKDGFNNGVKAIAIQSDNKILIGGAFASYNSTQSNFLIRLKGENTLNIESFDKKDILIYPNPTKQKLYVSGIELNESLTIINSYGQIVKTLYFNDVNIDISDLKTGIYFLKTNSAYIKFIKN